MSTDKITEDMLQAYVDEQLAPAERLQVETHLASHPDVAARISSARSLTSRKIASRTGVIDVPNCWDTLAIVTRSPGASAPSMRALRNCL